MRQETLIGSASHLLFSIFFITAVLRLSPIEDPATSIVPADFPTAPGPRAWLLIVMVLAQPQGERDLEPADKVACVTTSKATSHAFGSQYF